MAVADQDIKIYDHLELSEDEYLNDAILKH